MRGRRLRQTLPAALVALAAASAGACEIRIIDRNGGELESIAVSGGSLVELRYLHSVTRTIVRETLGLDPRGFVQQRIEFLEQGPGLPTQALAGERYVRLPDRFVYENMQRTIGVLDMRVDPAQRQELEADGVTHSLTRWGRRSLRLEAHDCH